MKPFFAPSRLLFSTLLGIACLHAQVNVTTQHNDSNRTGQNLSETVLMPSNVNVNQFGQLFFQTLDGYVYAQPLYLPNVTIPGQGTHNVVYVVTEHDSVYAFDADTSIPALWQVSFINAAKGITTLSSSDVGCSDLVPEIGITGTPVIDTVSGTFYVVSNTKQNGKFYQQLHALDITTGAEKFGGPVIIAAKVKGTGDGSVNGYVHFDPLKNNQRPGLLLQNGSVYIAWSSHCDIGPYHGWVISYNAQTLKQNGVWNSTPNAGLGGFWSGGAGIAADSSNNLYLASGNAMFDVNTGGRDFGDSIIKLSPPVNNRLHATDFFTPYDQSSLYDGDVDLGSGGVLLLPDQTGAHPHLLVESGKEGTIYLIDRDNMGHYNPNNNNQIVQSLNTIIGGVWGMPAWWNNNLYFGGSYDYLKAFSFNSSTELLSTAPTSESATYFNYPGPTPSISANGAANGIVWTLQTDGTGPNGSAILHAYDATNLATELYNSTQNPTRDTPGGAVKFTVPTIANGKVYVPAVDELSVYGILPGSHATKPSSH